MKLIKKLIVLWDQSGHDSIFFLPSPAPTRRGAGQDWLQPTAGAPARLDMSVTTVTNLIGKIYVSSGAGPLCTAPTHRLYHKAGYSVCDLKGTEGSEPCRTNAPLLHWCSRSELYVQTPSSRSGLQRHKHTQEVTARIHAVLLLFILIRTVMIRFQ